MLNLIIFIVIAIILMKYFLPNLDENTKTYIWIGVGLLFLWKLFGGSLSLEFMESSPKLGYLNPAKHNMPVSLNEDWIKSGLPYDHDCPKRPLIQHGQFEKELATNADVQQVLDQYRNKYKTEIPGYYLLNDNKYSENGIPFEKITKIIRKSKLNDLFEQHNHHIKWSPHTHIGKSRGYLNWNPVYPK